MTPRAQQAYVMLAGVFLAIGGAGVGLGLLDAVFGLGLFQGNPAPTALFLLAIGVALRWTARRGEVASEPVPEVPDDDEAPPA